MGLKIGISKEEITAAIENLKEVGFELRRPKPMAITIPDAKQLLMDIGEQLVDGWHWKVEYDEIADWITNNKNKGLFLIGANGQGKTIVATKILPLLIHHYYSIIPDVAKATDLAKDPDAYVKSRKQICIIDDIGAEGETINYGERRKAFAELCDHAEEVGKLLILTSNLDADDLRKKYGDRVCDRLRALTRAVVFNPQKSERK